MKSYSYLGWKGTSVDEEVLNFAVSLLPEIPGKYIFKEKDNRVIYRFALGNSEYFAKLNKPVSFYHKAKAFFFPNSCFEFKSAMLAELLGLPVVRASGWCAKDSMDMIVTENPGKSFVEAGFYWKEICLDNSVKRSAFLSGLSGFVRKYIAAGLYHRDFHLGNLLLEDKKGMISFILIDPLGIKRKRNSTLFNSGVLRLLGILKNDISCEDRVKFLQQAGIIGNESEFKPVWEKIISCLAKHEDRKWFGRRSKILKGNSRYSELGKGKDGLSYLVKKEFAGELCLDPDFCNNYERLVLNRRAARKYWLYSCFLQSHGIDLKMPVAWQRKKEEENLILMERPDDFQQLSDDVNVEEFAAQCKASGVKIHNIKTDVILRNGKPCLAESDPKRFNGNIYFF